MNWDNLIIENSHGVVTPDNIDEYDEVKAENRD